MTEVLYDGYTKLERFDLDGNPREVLTTFDSVHVLVHIMDTHEVVIVQQRRAPVLKRGYQDGFIIEAIGGQLDDESLSVAETMTKEALEEAGITSIETENIHWVPGRPKFVTPGVVTERTHMAVVQVFNDNLDQERFRFGLATEGECIGRMVVDEQQFIETNYDDLKLSYLQLWFKHNALQKET